MTTRQKLYISLLKRPIGILGALIGLFTLSPIIITTIIVLFFANKNGFKGIFFTQERPGKDEKIFKVIKFKTMTDERDSDGKLLPDNQRVTRIGKFIRSTSIDELPQLFNILAGDMAFIGPRPLTTDYLLVYDAFQHRRHEVTPGISGWAQVNGRGHCKLSKKFEYDVWYVDHISLKVDAKIFFLTIYNVLKRSDIGNGACEMENIDDLHIKEKLNQLNKSL